MKAYNTPLNGLQLVGESEQSDDATEIICRSRLGGLLKHYERRAAWQIELLCLTGISHPLLAPGASIRPVRPSVGTDAKTDQRTAIRGEDIRWKPAPGEINFSMTIYLYSAPPGNRAAWNECKLLAYKYLH